MSVKPKKKDIKKAVEKIPGLFFEQVEFTSTPKKDTPPENNYHQEKKKKGLMWFGVILLTIIILIMWSWSTFVNFDTLSKKKNDDSLLNQAKASLEQAEQNTKILETTMTTPTTTEPILNEEEIKLKIKNRLTSIINESSTTTLPTDDTTTTTAPQFNLSTSSVDATLVL